jgi:hypothetical protein
LTTCSAQAMCMAVGKVSLDDWLMLTWSFGWTGFLEPISPPSISMARFEITSLAFMFDWVPEPVCQTTSGKWSFSLPSMTSLAAAMMVSPSFGSSLPSAILVSAAARLTMPRARTIGSGCFSQPILKLPSDCAAPGRPSSGRRRPRWGRRCRFRCGRRTRLATWNRNTTAPPTRNAFAA